MSATRQHTIWCDALDEDDISCMRWYLADGEVEVVRQDARRYGWRRRRVGGRNVDLCPKHAAAAGTARVGGSA